jgi:aminomethyltransferase
MNHTVFEEIHKRLGAKMLPFAGYLMPIEYSGVNDEHLAVRQGVGVFDVSHMGVLWVKGPRAFDLIQKITTNDMSRLRQGRSLYSCMTNEQGGIVDDVIVYRPEEFKYFLVVNASNLDKDRNWILSQNSMGAEVEDASSRLSILAVQGPRALDVIRKLLPPGSYAFDKNTLFTSPVGETREVMVTCTGYTGAGGVELIHYNEDGPALWHQLFEAGAEYGIKPAGLGARDTLRLEMGYCLYGNDIDDTVTPLEAQLGWVVKFTEGNDFVGRSALEAQQRQGVNRLLSGIEMIDRGIPRHGYSVTDASGTVIGRVTSGTMAPSLKKGIGMAYVPSALASPGSEVFVEIRGRLLRAKVVERPFQ